MHLTQEALAEKAGLTARQIQRLEQGQSQPYPVTILHLARALKLTPDEHARFAAAGPRPRPRPPVRIDSLLDSASDRDSSAPPRGTVTFLLLSYEATSPANAGNEAARLAQLQVNARFASHVVQHSGRLLPAQDGLVVHGTDHRAAVFSSAGDALAVATLLRIDARWMTLPALGSVALRMALHTGEAYPDGDNYTGPALQQAERLLDRARGGQIVLSAITADLAQERLAACLLPELHFSDLGAWQLTPDEAPAHAFALVESSVWDQVNGHFEHLAATSLRAQDDGDFPAALTRLGLATALLDGVPQCPDYTRRRIDLLLNHAETFAQLGRLPEYDDLLQQHENDSVEKADLHAALLNRRARCAWADGNLPLARAQWGQALDLGRSGENATEAAVAHVGLQWCRLSEGDYGQILLCHEGTLDALAQSPSPCQRVWALAAVGCAYAFRGSREQALSAGREALATAESARDSDLIGMVHSALSLIHTATGYPSAGCDHARTALEAAHKPLDRVWARTSSDGRTVGLANQPRGSISSRPCCQSPAPSTSAWLRSPSRSFWANVMCERGAYCRPGKSSRRWSPTPTPRACAGTSRSLTACLARLISSILATMMVEPRDTSRLAFQSCASCTRGPSWLWRRRSMPASRRKAETRLTGSGSPPP